MSVIVSHNPGAPEEQVIEEMARDGFEATAKDYSSGRTEPHHHDYDVCLYILDGEFRLNEVARRRFTALDRETGSWWTAAPSTARNMGS